MHTAKFWSLSAATKLILLFCATIASGGCAFPINHDLDDTPPWSSLVGRIILTSQDGTLARNDPTEPLGIFPEPNYNYEYTSAHVYELPGVKKPAWPTVLLPKGTRLKITGMNHITYTPGSSYFSTRPCYIMHATIVSGPYAGVDLWTFWNHSPQPSKDEFTFAR